MDFKFKNIRSITTTSLKLRILKELKETKTVSELVKSLETSRDTIKPHLRRLLKAGLIERCSGGYRLTVLGQITFEKVVELERTMSLARESGEFFSSHDISQIPEELVKNINLLYGGFITRNRNPYELHEKWLEILRTSSWVKGVSPIYHPVIWGLRFFDHFKSRARKIDRLNHPWVYRNTHIKAEKK